MTIKRMIFRLGVRGLEALLMLMPARKTATWRRLMATPAEDDELDIVAIAFNNPFVLEQQMCFLEKNMVGPYKYIVVDNSSDKGQREKIRLLCERCGVDYVSMPSNRLGVVGWSYSHAGALNWAWRKIIRRRRPAYFGFVDHDLYPVQKIDIRAELSEQPVYGLLKEYGDEEKKYWYLWAGLCFYKYDFVKKMHLDFMPVAPNRTYLDTGGGNWYPMYSKMDRSGLHLADLEYVEYPEMAGMLDDKMALMDNGRWLHSTNGSNWKQKTEARDAVVEAVMRRFF